MRGTCYAFCSENDVLCLAAGTKTRLAPSTARRPRPPPNYFGFIFPTTGDTVQYAKLVQKPYDKSWLQLYKNLGDHMGCMNRKFAEKVVAPLLAPDAKPAGSADSHHAEISKPAGRS